MLCFFVRPVGFDKDQLTWLESLFSIAEGRLKTSWRWTTDGQADAYLVPVESVSQWEAYLAEFPRDRLIACNATGMDLNAVWVIKVSPEKRPGLPDLVKVLNAMGSQLAAGIPVLTGIEPPSGATAVEPRPLLAPASPQPTGPESSPDDIVVTEPHPAPEKNPGTNSAHSVVAVEAGPSNPEPLRSGRPPSRLPQSPMYSVHEPRPRSSPRSTRACTTPNAIWRASSGSHGSMVSPVA